MARQENCFVVTAAYGTPTVSEINRFRKFRDDNLVGNSLGERFLEAYYSEHGGQKAAEYLEEHPLLKEAVRRGVIDPMAKPLSYFQGDWEPEEYEEGEGWEEFKRSELPHWDSVQDELEP